MSCVFFYKIFVSIQKNTNIHGTFTEFGGKFLPSLAKTPPKKV